MAKYKHVSSGAVVDVRDDKVMDTDWEPVKQASTSDDQPAKRGPGRPRKSDS